MPHNPPVPKGSVSPFPLEAPQLAERAEARHDLAEQASKKVKAPDNEAGSGSPVLVGIAAGVVTVLAASLFYFKRNR
jgi:hypothetical protein